MHDMALLIEVTQHAMRKDVRGHQEPRGLAV